MAKPKNIEKHFKIAGGFISLPYTVFDSSAYRDLTPLARAGLLEFLRLYTPQRNGRLSISTEAMAQRLDVARNTAMPIFPELQGHGFVVMERGDLWQQKKAREWRVTFFPAQGREPTNDFLRWAPGEPVSTPISRTKKQNTGSKIEPDLRKNCARPSAKIEPDGGCGPETQTAQPIDNAEKTESGPERKICAPYNIPRVSGVRGQTSEAGPASSPRRSGRNEPSLSADGQGGEPGRVSPTHAERPGSAMPGAISDIVRSRPSGSVAKPANSDTPFLFGDLPAAPTPTEMLRARLNDVIAASPRGTTSKIAARIGVSRSHVANFRSGTYDLNPTSAAALRELLSSGGAP